ncbi:NirA family protein [uncultured Rubinisphaera sp.]|uniref:NirA family protein n=1 Tax=uncultured Rubinisphaera sp. TaxID=1678686 RepID=UPI0030D8B358
MNQSYNPFDDEQKNYLQGFMMGADVSRAVRGLPILSGQGLKGTSIQVGGTTTAVPESIAGPERIHREAQDRFLANKNKLCAEEQAKRDKNPLDMWNEMLEHAASDKFPKGTDVFLFKFQGLFYVSPAQDAYMCRLRIPGGILRSDQFRGVAELAETYAGGYADVTTRANLQLREISPKDGVPLLMGLQEHGIIVRGSGGDNIRNVTGNPTSGIDPQEIIETLPLAREMHHFILNHRELYGLPRKFNIAFEGGGSISSLEETNDIGFTAVKVNEEHATIEVPAGVYFRLTLGGITGHLDFARDTGVLVLPSECVPVADAILRVFIANGDRTDRKNARLKYVLDDWGFEKFIEETQKLLNFHLRKFDLTHCEKAAPADRYGHVGVHPQKQEGLNYIGVVLPVGRLTPPQIHGLADIAESLGDRKIRLTVWQNLLLSGIPDDKVSEATSRIEALGLDWKASNVRGALVACTGNAGCKYAAANTKLHAGLIADYLEERIELDSPINIHLTGCHHSCAQHYIGDIGLIATKVEVGEDEDMVEGYHIFVGGGYGPDQGIGREFKTSVTHEECPAVIARLLLTYHEHRMSEQETFVEFVNRVDMIELNKLYDGNLVMA